MDKDTFTLINTLISVFFGLFGVVIGTFLSNYFNNKSDKNNIRFNILNNCIEHINKLHDLIINYNKLLKNTINNYSKEEIVANKDNIQDKIKIGFQKLVLTEKLINSKLFRIQEKELIDSIEKMLKLICLFHTELLNERTVEYDYTMKSYNKYTLDLDYKYSEIINIIKNFKIN